jgi:methyl-accepting chemotaxis protein
MRPFRRRQYIVDSFQRRLVVINLVYFFTIVLAFIGVLLVPVLLELSDATLGWERQQEAANQFLSIHTRLWPAVLILFLLLSVHSILVSHRIAGPLYRFRRIFDDVQKGDLSTRVVLRQGDYLTKEAEGINAMLSSLSNRFERIQATCEELQSSIAEIRKTFPLEEKEWSERATASLESRIEQLRTTLVQICGEKTSTSESPSDEKIEAPRRGATRSTV